MINLIRIVLVVFVAYTVWVLMQTGVVGFFGQLFSTAAGIQAFVDLVIALSLLLGFIRADARRKGRTFWPWLLLTLGLGSIGPLAYLASARRSGPDARA